MIYASAHRGEQQSRVERHGLSLCVLHHMALRRAAAIDGADNCVVFDGRLDNRKDLLGALGGENEETSDPELVLAAYRRWGRDAPGKLIGDFALAIWDEKSGALLVARDPFGIRPLCYHHNGADFWFASEPRALLAAIPRLADEPDEIYLADFMAAVPPPADATAYRGIKRLAPGHLLTVKRSGYSLERYYSVPQGIFDPRQDSVDQFLTTFEEAVTCRLAGDRPVGALLSGGLDSSSIVSVAAPYLRQHDRPPLSTFSMVYADTQDEDERPFIDEVINLGHIKPYFLESSAVPAFADIHALLDQQSGPFIGPNLAASRRLFDFARERGHSVLLDGHGGDEVISFGGSRLHDLAYHGRWWVLWRELQKLCAQDGINPQPVFLRMIARAGPHRRMKRRLGDYRRRFNPAIVALPPGADFVEPALARRSGFEERLAIQPTDSERFGREERAEHYETVTGAAQPYGLEVVERAAAYGGVELRLPFWDRRLVELSLSLPSEDRLRDGYTRSIVRRSLAAKLPDAVRARPGKLNFGPHITRGMRDHDAARIDAVLKDQHGMLAYYAKLDTIGDLWQRIKAGDQTLNGYQTHAVWRAAALGFWLEKSGN